jgi:hypothetical protein
VKEKEPVAWADEATPFTGAEVLELLKENERLRQKVVRVLEWTFMYGKELVPPPSYADTFGDGVRSSKQLVKRILEK